jgi:hypothetical protein
MKKVTLDDLDKFEQNNVVVLLRYIFAILEEDPSEIDDRLAKIPEMVKQQCRSRDVAEVVSLHLDATLGLMNVVRTDWEIAIREEYGNDQLH